MTRMKWGVVAAIVAIGVAALVAQSSSNGSAKGATTNQAPIFEVDPLWPKPLPNHWVMGSTIGLSVDAQDHVWVIHRPQTRACPGLESRRSVRL